MKLLINYSAFLIEVRRLLSNAITVSYKIQETDKENDYSKWVKLGDQVACKNCEEDKLVEYHFRIKEEVTMYRIIYETKRYSVT